MNAVDALTLSKMKPAIGSTSECCFGRSVPPVTTTVMRGMAASSSRAIVRLDVKTVTSDEVRAGDEGLGDGGGRCPDVEDDRLARSDRAGRMAADPGLFGGVLVERFFERPLKTEFRIANDGSTVNPLRAPWSASSPRSVRTVTSEIPKMSVKSATRMNSRSRTSDSIRSRRSSGGMPSSINLDLTAIFICLSNGFDCFLLRTISRQIRGPGPPPAVH